MNKDYAKIVKAVKSVLEVAMDWKLRESGLDGLSREWPEYVDADPVLKAMFDLHAAIEDEVWTVSDNES